MSAAPRQKAFVAYPSHDKTVAQIIANGVLQANAAPIAVRYEPWTFNDIPGTPIVSPILTKIEQSAFIVADITYLNLNVVYEIGYAIGKGKRAFLIRHAETEGDRQLAREAGIFDTLGYHEYSDAESLSDRLTSQINNSTELSPGPTLDRLAPIYIVEPPTRTNAAATMISRIKKKAKYRYRSFNPSEDSRLSAMDAANQVAASSGVMTLLQNGATSGHAVHNVRSLFVAGLAHGMGKPCLILSPADYDVPLDVRDTAKLYRDDDVDISAHIAAFCPEVTEYSQRADPPPLATRGRLQTLSIGDPTAENEMTTLSHYYLQTDQFQRALRGEVNLVVGRKGSGKTALFIQVRDRIRTDKRNIVVDLKPEGYQLIKLKEDILSYVAEGARQHLITAFWDYLILLEVAHKLLEKDQHTFRFDNQIGNLYLNLQRIYCESKVATEGDFSERLLALSERIAEQYSQRYGSTSGMRLTSEQVTELLYSHDIKALRKHLSLYLKTKHSTWVLFDNLDKGWSTQGVDQIDTIILRCLIDAGRKVEREMRRDDLRFRCIVFVRNDVYDHLMHRSADYGKEMRATLDWTDPDMLRAMMRLRLMANLKGRAEDITFEQLWSAVCTSHYRGEDSAAYLIDRSLMRPRNLLKLFNHARGFANNFGHPKITEEDIEKGLKVYSQDLLMELDRELTDVFPSAKDLLYYFLDTPSLLAPEALERLVVGEAKVKKSEADQVIDFLLYYGVVGVHTEEQDYYIYNVNYDLKILKIRAERSSPDGKYTINPAFWPALGVREG